MPIYEVWEDEFPKHVDKIEAFSPSVLGVAYGKAWYAHRAPTDDRPMWILNIRAPSGEVTRICVRTVINFHVESLPPHPVPSPR